MQGDAEDDGSISHAAAQLNPSEIAPTKTLGVPWDTETDEFCLTLNALTHYPSGRITKRILLSAAVKVFDPSGMLAPITVTLKILYQTVCQKSETWDELLPPKIQEIWDKFLEEAKEFRSIRIPRCYGDVMNGYLYSYVFVTIVSHRVPVC